MPECSADKLVIDELTIDKGQWQVYRHEEKVEMTKQSLDLLLALAQAWPNTLSQQDLMDKVWAGRVVSEQSVKQAIKRLRESLGDLGEGYIKAVRGRGYRLDCKKVETIVNKPVDKQTSANETADKNLTPTGKTQKTQKTGEFRPSWIFVATVVGFLISVYVFSGKQEPSSSLAKKPKLDSGEVQQGTKSAQAYQYYKSGQEYYQRYRVEDAKIAVNQFNKAIELDKNFVKAYAALSDAQSLIGDLDDAIVTAQYAISLDPDESAAYKALGHAYSIKGWFKKAIESYQKAVEIDPENFAAISNMGFHYRELGRLDKALYWHLKALELNSTHAVIYLHVAESLSNLGLKNQAQQWFDKVKSVRPDYYQLHYSLIYFYLAQGDFAKAGQTVAQALTILPDNPDIITASADLALVNGEIDSALTSFLKVVSSEQNHKLTHYAQLRVGQIYWLKGDMNTANTMLNNALDRAQSMLAAGDEWPGNYADIASIYAIKKSHDGAIAWLKRAVDVGWVNYRRLTYDPAFADMQELPEFKAIINRIESKVLTMREKALKLSLNQLNEMQQ